MSMPTPTFSPQPRSAPDFSALSTSGASASVVAATTAAAPGGPSPARRDRGKSKAEQREAGIVPASAPAWSEMKTKAGKERKRLPLACKSCRRKKVRCSGETPACKHCLRARIPCVYKVTQRKATPRTDYMTMLDKRLKRMEDRVIKLIPSADSARLSAIGRASVKPPSAAEKAKSGSKKRAAVEAFAPDQIDLRPPPDPKDLSDTSSVLEGKEFLPPKEIQEHLAETYFDQCYGQPYHLLHKPSFMRRLREDSLPAVLMLAVCCVSARFSKHPYFANETHPAVRGEVWAAEARRVASRSLTEPNLTTVIVVTLLALYDFGSCQGSRAWMHSGIAMRMSYALALNTEYEPDSSGVGPQKPLIKDKASGPEAANPTGEAAGMSFTDQEIRRRTMWSCYLMDCFNSSGTKRPMFDHLQHLKIQLPIKEAYFQLEVPGRTEDIHGEPGTAPLPGGSDEGKSMKENMGVAAYLVKTLAIWAKVITYSNTLRMHHDKKPPWNPDSEFSRLEAEVRRFGQSLPNFLRYTPENRRSHEADKLGNQFVFMHVVYQQIILFIYKFTIPAFPGSKIPSEMPRDYLLRARRTAVEAASKISKILDESKGISLTAPFASYCAFASSNAHIWGMFSKDPKLAEMSKANLTINMRYLNTMKRYWSMIHYMTENLKSIFKQHADAAKLHSNSQARKLSEETFFSYGEIQEFEPSAEIAEEHGITKQPQSPNGKARNADLSSNSKLLKVSDWFQAKSQSPQLNNAEIPNRAAKRGKQSHGTPASMSDASASRFGTPPNVASHTPTPPDTTGNSGMSNLRLQQQQQQQPQQQSTQGFPPMAQTRYANANNPYLDRGLAASFTMASIMDANGGAGIGRMPVQSYDRQLVFGAYAQDPSLPYNPAAFETPGYDPAASGALDFSLMSGALDPGIASQIGMSATSAAGGGLNSSNNDNNNNSAAAGSFGDAAAAWITPFHMVPPMNLVQPDFGQSMDAGGGGGGHGGNNVAAALFGMNSDVNGDNFAFWNS